MAVNELDAKTRAVDKMKAEPGKELAAYQAAENQLLAIRAEQKQNLALARQESVANQQQNAMMGQAAELAASSGGAGVIQAPVNAATQNVLAKYGAGPTISKSTQRTTQQVTKQNITINNYNNTTNNTTNNVPNTGPVQGRPVVVNRDDTGRFKVWVKNALDRQNEQAAIRDREYQRRESALTRSANKMTRKLESVSNTISSRFDPRRMNTDLVAALKKVLMLVGVGFLASNWPKVLDVIGNIEKKIRNLLEYVGITGGAERKKTGADTGLVRDIKYLLLGEEGKNVKGGIGAALKEAFDGIWESIKKTIGVWLDARAEAIKAIPFPELSKNPTKIGESLGKIAGYVGDILAAMIQGPGATAKRVAKEAREEAVQESISEKNDDRAVRKEGSFVSVDGKEHSTSVGDYVMHGYDGANNLLATDIKDDKLTNNVGASIRQSNYIATNLAGENGKINPLGIIEGLNKLESSAVDNKYTIVDPYLLGMLQSKLGVYTQDLANTKKEFKYISIAKTEEEKEYESSKNTGAKVVGGIAGAMAGLAAPSGKAVAAGIGAKYGAKAANWLASEENTIKLVEVDDPAYKDYPSINNKLDGLTAEQKKKLEYNVLTKEDIETIKKRIAEKLGKDKISFEADDLESTQLLGEYITNQLQGKEVSETYTNGIANIKAAQEKVDAVKEKQKEIWENSKIAGIGERAAELAGEAKDFATTGYTQSIGGDEAPTVTQAATTINNVNKGVRTKLQDIRKKDNWDVDRAIDTIKSNAEDSSKGSCLRYTGNAISSGFGQVTPIENYHTKADPNMGGITSAKYSGLALERLGFEQIPNDSTLQKGDIHVFQPTQAWANAGHPHGHIEMYDGSKWFSDFKQKTSGLNWGHYKSMATYRWGEDVDGEDSDIIEESAGVNTTTTPASLATTSNSTTTSTTSATVDENDNVTSITPEQEAALRAQGLAWDSKTGSVEFLQDVEITPGGPTITTPESYTPVMPSLATSATNTSTIARATQTVDRNGQAVQGQLNQIMGGIQNIVDVTTLAAEASARNVDATTAVATTLASTGAPSPVLPRAASVTAPATNGNI